MKAQESSLANALFSTINLVSVTPEIATDPAQKASAAVNGHLLQWRLEKEFKARLWSIRRDLRETGEALVETQRARRQIDESMRRQPIEFERFAGRVAALEPRIEAMKMRIEDQMAAQRAYLQSMAVGQLQAQKERLDIYTVQARFALAGIYDIAATVGEVSE